VRAASELSGRQARRALKYSGEIILAHEAHAEANLAYREFITAQETFGTLDSLAKNVPVGALSYALPERPAEVKRAHGGRFRQRG